MVKAKKLSYLSDLISAISLEAFDCRGDAYDRLIQKVRPHKGQIKTANNIREFLKGSKIQKRKDKHVQDPYSFRCIPQVHGATKDVISHVESIFNTEINSVTDNPNIFKDIEEGDNWSTESTICPTRNDGGSNYGFRMPISMATKELDVM